MVTRDASVSAVRPAAAPKPDASTVTRLVRDDIISGAYPPGHHLTEEGLAERLGVSRIPVREALRTLDAEGFIHSRPHAGAFVAELTVAEAEDLLEVRALLEPLGAARAAARRSADDLGRLRDLLARAEDSLEAPDAARDPEHLAELARLNTHFHQTLAQASGSLTLSRLITQLGQKIAWVYTRDLPARAADSWAEHAEVVDAIAAGDAEQARHLVAHHIAQAQSAYRLRTRGR